MRELRKHPSGRPIVRKETKPLSICRSPGIGNLVPRLQLPQPANAIGFHHFVIKDDVDDR